MIRDLDFIVVGLQPWDIKIGSNCKNIAIELAKNNRVLYVNPPLDRVTAFRKKNDQEVKKRISIIKGELPSLQLVRHNLWNLYPVHLAESINWISNSFLFHALNRLNNYRLAGDIRSACDSLGMQNYVLFNDQSMIRCYYLNEMLDPDLFVYYIRDNLNGIDYFKRHALEMERNLIAKADVVATNSDYLAEMARQWNPDAAMVGQGCDFSLYNCPDSIPVSELVSDIPSPRIGYTGFLTDVRLDIKLLESVAESRSDWHFVLAGPEDETFKASTLHFMPNVHFLGNRKPEELPGIIQGFDVCINPQVINEVTVGNYPRKIDEYLAMGKPVVATATPFMNYFKDHVCLAIGRDEYIKSIEMAIRDTAPEAITGRIKYAMTHSWESSVEKLSTLIEQKLQNNVKARA
jgi:glycosyltransferase involved in cell wall biosynthesis